MGGGGARLGEALGPALGALVRRTGLQERAGVAPEAAAAAAVFLLELSCLRRGAACFAEQLYGLRRAPLPRWGAAGPAAGSGPGERLSLPLADRFLVALAASAAPQLRALLVARRADARSLGRARAAADWLRGGGVGRGGGTERGEGGAGPAPERGLSRLFPAASRQRVWEALAAWLPGILLAAWDAASLASAASHALGLSLSGPGLVGLLLGHRLVRVAPGDQDRLLKENRRGRGSGGAGARVLDVLSGAPLRALAAAVLVGAQAAEWWRQAVEAADQRRAALSAPPPPAFPPAAPQGARKAAPGLCPACGEPYRHPAVLAPSGRCLCHACALRCASPEAAAGEGGEGGRCPVTHAPVTPEHVVRLYLPS